MEGAGQAPSPDPSRSSPAPRRCRFLLLRPRKGQSPSTRRSRTPGRLCCLFKCRSSLRRRLSNCRRRRRRRRSRRRYGRATQPTEGAARGRASRPPLPRDVRGCPEEPESSLQRHAPPSALSVTGKLLKCSALFWSARRCGKGKGANSV